MGKGLGRENGVLVVCSAPKSMHHMCRAEFRVCVCSWVQGTGGKTETSVPHPFPPWWL